MSRLLISTYGSSSLDVLANALGLELADGGLQVRGGDLVVDDVNDLGADLADLCWLNK